MEAHAVPLLAIFEKKMRLEVPLFQRQYVWSQEHQWEPLWEDISRKFSESLSGRKDSPVHFLGAMVLDQKQTPTTHVEKRQVIDGQQRLTTFQIFLAAYRDFCRGQGCEDLAKECDSFTENKGMMADPKTDRFKVWPTQSDRIEFANVISARSPAELNAKYPIVKRKYQRRPDPRPKIVEAYFFFYGELEEFFLGTDKEPAIHSDVPLADRLEECFQALRNSLQVVTIDLKEGDDPQVIFETLNARGEPLLPADLLRNYIFLRAGREGIGDQAELYDKYWLTFDDAFWREEVKQGRLIRPRSDLFMQHFLASQLAEDIPIKHLFVEYKNWIERKKPYSIVEEELASVARQGEHFRRILQPAPQDRIHRLASFLEAFDIRTAYPLLLAIMDWSPSDEVWPEITDVIESYLLRRAVCAYSTKNYNRVFLQLTRTVRRDGVSPDIIARQLAGQTGESAEWPDDAAFGRAWLEKAGYDLGNAKLVHIFTRLNSAYVTGMSEPLMFQQKPTIEHIMPQSWIEHWPLADGSTGMNDSELSAAPEGNARADATLRRRRAVQSIGNLTLLTQALNSHQSHSAWGEKKPEMLKHSLLSLNQDLHKFEAWNEEAIEQRSRDLLDRACFIWPGPAKFART